MKLATIRSSRGLRVAVLCRADGDELWVDLADAASRFLGDGDCPSSMKGVLCREGPGLSTVRQVVAEVEAGAPTDQLACWPVHGARLASPVPDPGSLLDFYAFEEHVRAARARRGLEIVPEWHRYPVYYRSNQRAVVAHGAEVWFPPGEERKDYELELAAILGSALESPSPEEAEKAIVGYCLMNDWSARAIQAETMKVGLGPSKGKDFATSLGPWIVTPDELGDLSEVVLEARVNAEVWSRGRLGDMRWRWGEMIAFAGECVRFEPGDVLGSGTVGGGCGLEMDRYLEAGDVVELDGGESLGVLAGTVRQLDSSATES